MYLMNEECEERLRLVDRYSRSVTKFNDHLELLRSGARDGADWIAAQLARESSQHAWEALNAHIAEHRCDLPWTDPEETVLSPIDGILKAAAMAALDVILVADDDRRYVEVNEAAADALKMPRHEIIGRKIDDFFIEARDEIVPTAWADFVADGVQHGICVLKTSGAPRRFEYLAKANFAPGLHLSILREVS
jgi:PAS domain-containing protein